MVHGVLDIPECCHPLLWPFLKMWHVGLLITRFIVEARKYRMDSTLHVNDNGEDGDRRYSTS